MVWIWPETFEIAPLVDEHADSKRAFGKELSKGYKTPLDAALVAFPKDTGLAMWAATNWMKDPLVLEEREKSLNAPLDILDKKTLTAKVLEVVDAKSQDGLRYIVDPKERLAGLKLIAELNGLIDKSPKIDQSINTFKQQSMTIRFVRSPHKEEQKTINKTIENIPVERKSLPNVKLVKSS